MTRRYDGPAVKWVEALEPLAMHACYWDEEAGRYVPLCGRVLSDDVMIDAAGTLWCMECGRRDRRARRGDPN